MTRFVGAIDVVTAIACVMAAAILTRHWRGRFHKDVKLALAVLLGVSGFRYLSNALEWCGITAALDPLEDFIEILEPVLWGGFFYTFLRSQAAERLRESRQQYQTLVENIDLGITRISADYEILMTNAANGRMLAKPVSEFVGRKCFEEFQKRHDVCTDCPGKRAMATGRPAEIETQGLRDDGRRVPVRIQAFPLSGPDGEPAGFIEVVEDITGRKQAEGELRKSEAAMQSIFRAAPVGIGVVCDRVFIRVNDRVCEMTGYDRGELLGQNARMLYPTDEEYEYVGREKYGQISQRGTGTVETRWKRKDGSVMDVLLSSAPLDPADMSAGVTFTALDITERKRAEEQRLALETQIQHAQKLESLGVLAGGIAHDFNNILTAILGNAELAMRKISPVSPVHESLVEIGNASRRAADLCRQMLAYSGRGRFLVEPIDLSEVLKEMSHMLRVSISKKAVLKYNFGRDLPAIQADATQIRQIAMNLIINASEAIGDRSGIISVTTGAMDCDRAYLAETYLADDLPEGLYVTFEVADTGCGIDETTLAKLFDPFFTTKFTGRGLGLAAVLGIVRGHNGAIKIYSEPGRGTTFKVLFPAATAQAVSMRDDMRAAGPRWQGSGLVLLVDDEESVRGLGKRAIEELGFDVLLATDGREGVELYRQRCDEIVLVLLDLTMPHLGGEEAFREMRRIRPDVPVILTSGYNESEVTERFVGKGLAGFIQKPYRIDELAAKLKQALGD